MLYFTEFIKFILQFKFQLNIQKGFIEITPHSTHLPSPAPLTNTFTNDNVCALCVAWP